MPSTRNAAAQQPQISEYKVKAAFLFNFAKFVEWPPEAFASADSPFVIGVFGENPFGDDLADTVRNKTINNHPFSIKVVKSLGECTNCHMLFVSIQEKKRVSEILGEIRNASVLSVGEMDGFTEAGGVINLVRDGQKFRFEINTDSAKKSNLKISSKLLGLALPASH
jgi:hypothetical protein